MWWKMPSWRLRRLEVNGSGGEVNDRVGWFGGKRLPAVDLAHGDLSGREQRPKQHSCGLRRRQDGLGLDAALELLVQPFDGIGGARRAPLAGRQAGEGEQPVTRFLQAVGDRPALQPPLAQEGLAPFLDLFRGFGVDHVGIVGRDLFVQMVGGVREQVPVLVDGAALGRHLGPQRRQRLLEAGSAVDDQEFGRLQPAGDQVVEERPPSGLALAAHVLHYCLQELRWLGACPRAGPLAVPAGRRDLAEARADLAAWIGKWQAKYPRLVAWVDGAAGSRSCR